METLFLKLCVGLLSLRLKAFCSGSKQLGRCGGSPGTSGEGQGPAGRAIQVWFAVVERTGISRAYQVGINEKNLKTCL